jgi:hypothetical protein
VGVDLRDLSETGYVFLEYCIAEHEHITGPQLAAALRANRGEEIPDRLFDYLCSYLEGRVKKRPGPKKKTSLAAAARPIVALATYDQFLREERAKPRARGRSRAGADEAAHLAAARRICDEFFPHSDVLHVVNELSKFRKLIKFKQ